MLNKIFKIISQHKIIAIIIVLLMVSGGYFGHKALKSSKERVRYVLAEVKKGTIIVSVSGSGQVSTSDQLDIKSKVNGEVAAVYVEKGEEVKIGKLIIKIDDTDSQKAVRDAETSLETAKLELEKLSNPPDELALLQAENSLVQARESKQKAEETLEKTYEDGLNNVTSVFLDLPDIMAGLRDILFSCNFNGVQQNIDYYADAVEVYDEKVLQYKADTYDKYQIARKAYEQNSEDYRWTNRFSEKNVIESLIERTYKTTRDIAETVKSTNNLIQLYQDEFRERNLKPQAFSDTHLSNLNAYAAKINSHLLSLLSIQRSLKDSKAAIVNAERTIQEKEMSLARLKTGSDELDIRAKKITVQQKEDALLTAKQNLINCYITVPFDGIIADIKAKKGDSASSGTVLASVITKQKIAEISLNEVDAAKVKTGQKTTLTFDALPELTISGQVIEIDAVGTAVQGVVSYGVKIAFDAQDERVKSGMSITADIITETKQDVLVLPNGAIKSQGNSYSVELVEVPEEMRQQLLASVSGIVLSGPSKLQSVEVGLANDLSIEILSGLKEGDIVVISTVNQNKTQTTKTQTTRGFQMPGMGSPPTR